MQPFRCGVIALALLAGTSLAFAQQNKTQQNSADEALTRSAPEAKDPPAAPPHISPTQASQPGLDPQGPVLSQGQLQAPGAQQDGQDVPAKFSEKNDRIDKTPIMAYPLSLTDEQKRTIYQRLSQGEKSKLDIAAKPSEQVPATLALQELPQDLAASMPGMRDYKVLPLDNRILVVNPRESIVVGEITNEAAAPETSGATR